MQHGGSEKQKKKENKGKDTHMHNKPYMKTRAVERVSHCAAADSFSKYKVVKSALNFKSMIGVGLSPA